MIILKRVLKLVSLIIFTYLLYQFVATIIERSHFEEHNDPFKSGTKINPIQTPMIKDANVDLLILINSNPHTINARKLRYAIRETWGNCTLTSCQKIFFMGQTEERNLAYFKELKEYSDMLIFDYYDNYKNITLKLLATFEWVSKFIKAKYILKTDDDVYVNIEKLLLKLRSVKSEHFYGGIVWNGYVQRNGRHAVSRTDYALEKYPPFCKGALFIFSFALTADLLKVTKKRNWFGVDDAFVGVLMHDIGVDPHEIREFVHFHSMFLELISDCSLVNNIGFADGFSDHHIRLMHSRITSHNGKQAICFSPQGWSVLLLLVSVLVCILSLQKLRHSRFRGITELARHTTI